MSMGLIRSTSLKSRHNSARIDRELCEIIGAEVLLSCIPVTLNGRQGHLDRYQNAERRSIYHFTQLKPYWIINGRCIPTVYFLKFFFIVVVFDAVSETALIFLSHTSYSKVAIVCLRCIASTSSDLIQHRIKVHSVQSFKKI